MAEAPVPFVLDGREVAAECEPTTTLLQYLRETLGRTGTKEGCAEGDCGACTVVIGEPGPGRMDYRAVNACIRFLPTVAGKEVITVESLRQPDGSLHPVQQAMVEAHASQCGFCTPGFVMSLFALYLNERKPDRGQVLDALAGNLCRCTGYRPIVDAGLRMKDHPEPSIWSRADAQNPERSGCLSGLKGVPIPGFAAPSTVDELARLYEAAPQSLLLAGGTDVGLWVTKQLRALPPIIYLGEVRDLKQVVEVNGWLEIGAAVPLTEAAGALVRHYPGLGELFNRFASPPIRNSGTLCGNIANGSPIGDSMPPLIALGAEVVLRQGASMRTLPLEDLYLAYRKTALQAGEFVAAVRVPLLDPAGQLFGAYKISKREEQDISAVCLGYRVRLEAGTVREVRLAYGGMAGTPKRAAHAEQALLGRPWSVESIREAKAALAGDFQPMSDMRASSAYRLRVAAGLLERLFLEQQSGGIAVRLTEVSAA